MKNEPFLLFMVGRLIDEKNDDYIGVVGGTATKIYMKQSDWY
jgi:hypothetical protein